MKYTVDKGGNSFRPVTISITCETQAELDALGTVFDTAFLGDATQNLFGINITSIYPAFTGAEKRVDELISEFRRICTKHNY